ncbi:MAG TPA: MOSC domain-containing protein [Actinopolymorphaceae bacterium]
MNSSDPEVDAAVDSGVAPVVSAVSRDSEHRFSKQTVDEIMLLAGLGVEGDTHAGRTVQHRSRVARDPSQPNLRQVHLVHAELHDELQSSGFWVTAGQLGENITTRGLDLLGLPRGTILRFADQAAVEITGLRNPCTQIDDFRPGLLKQVIGRDEHGNIVRKAGVMGIVLHGGPVRPGDTIEVLLPAEPHQRLERV